MGDAELCRIPEKKKGGGFRCISFVLFTMSPSAPLPVASSTKAGIPIRVIKALAVVLTFVVQAAIIVHTAVISCITRHAFTSGAGEEEATHSKVDIPNSIWPRLSKVISVDY